LAKVDEHVPAPRVVHDDRFDPMKAIINKAMIKQTTVDQASPPIDRARAWGSPLVMLVTVAMFGVAGVSAQTVHVGIETKTVDSVAKAGVKIWIGEHLVTTDRSGTGELNIPTGTYTARAETKCRVVRVAASSNLQPGARSTEPVLTFSLPQDLPAGILFELDCKKPRVRGKTKGKTVSEKLK
jgi:hypothetical protein